MRRFPRKLLKASSMNKAWISTGFLVLVLAASCQTTKKATRKAPAPPKTETARSKKTPKKASKKPIPPPPIASVPGPKADLTPSDPAYAAVNDQLNRFSGRPLIFQTFSGKAKAKLTRGDESNEFTANIRIRQGSAIWINISALGGMLNVARIYVTPDSVRMINFLQKKVTLLPAADAGKLLPVPVSFNDLQALLLGYAPQPALLPENAPVTIRPAGDTLKRQLVLADLLQTEFFTLPDSTFRAYELARNAVSQPFVVRMLLSNPIQETNRRFYKDRLAQWSASATSGELQLQFDTPQWDGELAMPFSVPKSYDLN
ncbi:MAG: DUF4292 domain-containing protein [Sphingobacteriales bacterium]|nr:MAG: DUF4292 domain-containing protein [Sphingobacteriales bacterium]